MYFDRGNLYGKRFYCYISGIRMERFDQLDADLIWLTSNNMRVRMSPVQRKFDFAQETINYDPA